MNEVVEEISISVTDFVSPQGTPVPVVQMTFKTRSDPDDPTQRRSWPTFVLRPSTAGDLLQSLSTAVTIVRRSEENGNQGKTPIQ